ncbi:MAG TPA: protein kinase [Candidatus Desulfaltia sp.]|nr:protein kinase [Candidatus Desulfaltia sp.]
MKCPQCQTDISDDSRFCSKCGTPVQAAERIVFSQTRTILRPMEELAPETLLAGKYRILKVVGRGGMGIVYEAEDTKLQRHVALKFLPPELVLSPEARERFVLEARAAAALSHPNICTIYEIHDEGEKPFIAMEYIEGQSLKATITKNPISEKDALGLAIQVSEGLEEAHRKGIIHRDIKSANIMVTDKGQAKIMDFGLAKVKGGTLLTREGTTLGTVAYMSPEQALGKEVDHRTDIWSLGVVLYELLSGKLPFQGDHEASILYTVVHEEPKPLKGKKPPLPQELQQVIRQALNKNPDSRHQSAAEVGKDLRKYQEALKAEAGGVLNLRMLWKRLKRPIVAIPSVIVLIALVLLAFLFFSRMNKVRWAREQAVPEILRLADLQEYQAAFDLAVKTEKYISGEPILANAWPKFSRTVSIRSEPPGSSVYLKDYSAVELKWQPCGQTPIDHLRVPRGRYRLKMAREGFTESVTAFIPEDGPVDLILAKEEDSLAGMVFVKGGAYYCDNNGLDHLPEVELVDFLIDKFEVTNKEFMRFLESGGYQKKEYWKHPFVKNGVTLTWDKAMAEFVDKTGRPGPASWEAGYYLPGQDNFPVGGISWYEAAAYAEFAGKSLPTIYHWSAAASILWIQYIVPLSNFNQKGPASVGTFQGVSTCGTFDMAGNVREWCWNDDGDNHRYIFGGGWNDNEYSFCDAFAANSFDRSLTNGLRCIKYLTTEKNLADLQRPIKTAFRDFLNEKPISDEIFKVYKRMYAYDKTPLNPKIESEDGSSEAWTKEKISFDAAYGNERVMAFLYLPKKSTPPYQVVVYFPGSGAIFQRSNEALESGQMRAVDYIVKNGRAVMIPIYKGTYERGDGLQSDYPAETNFYKEHVLMWSKDVSRTIDYLETRKDIASDKIAYFGYSWGAAMGAIMPAVEERLKAAILYVAGFYLQRTLPEVDQINFVSRVRIPVLMLNGKYDYYYPPETSQKPMFALLGTPAEHKRQIIYDSSHLVPRSELIKETLAWLDTYLGPVR